MYRFGKTLLHRSLPDTHQACNHQAGLQLQLQVAGEKPGVECCRSPRVNSHKKRKNPEETAWECGGALLYAAIPFQIISAGGVGGTRRHGD